MSRYYSPEPEEVTPSLGSCVISRESLYVSRERLIVGAGEEG